MKQYSEIIIFDLGGVLIELGAHPIPPEWLPDDSKFDLADWFASDTARLFEKGLIDPQQFSEKLKKDLRIQATAQEVVEHFTQWPVGLFPGARELLLSIDRKFGLVVLSNTNELHWPRIIDEFRIGDYFERIYSSHHLNQAKPGKAIFQYVMDDLQVAPQQIIFLDDSLSSVEMSQQLGMRGMHVRGIEEVREALIAVGAIGDIDGSRQGGEQ